MTREEIIELARNCGSAYVNRHHPGYTSFGFTEDCLLRFAELIAKAEREECAKVCDNISGGHWFDFKNAPMSDLKRGNVYVEGQSDGADDCANAIRARGDK